MKNKRLSPQKLSLLSQNQLKSTLGGGILRCKTEYETGCTVLPNGPAELKCCTGLECQINATGTGTICVPPEGD